MKKKSSVLVNTLVLFAVTFVAVLALALVNQVTKAPIAQAEANARAEIYSAVYPNADSFEELENSETMINESGEMLSQAGYDGCTVSNVLAVVNGDSTDGYVISAVSPNGYGGDVEVAIGINADGIIVGFDIISQNETAGLGSKCTESDFKEQFSGKEACMLEYTKTGASADNEIDAISGATITTNAVTEAVNSAIVFYENNLKGE